jgi:acyl-CoA dehydrogenase
MLPPPSPRSAELAQRITAFMEEHTYPAEALFEREVREGDHWDEPPVMGELKRKARAANLWNLFVPKKHDPDGLSVVEYAPLCEIMGRSPIGAEPFNCSAPDTGNMETLMLYGSDAPARRRQLRHQRTKVVDVGRDGQALQARDLHGPHRPGCAIAQAPVDDPGAARLARH